MYEVCALPALASEYACVGRAEKSHRGRGKMRHRQGCGRDMPPEAVQLQYPKQKAQIVSRISSIVPSPVLSALRASPIGLLAARMPPPTPTTPAKPKGAAAASMPIEDAVSLTPRTADMMAMTEVRAEMATVARDISETKRALNFDGIDAAADDEIDPYVVLGLKQSATPAEIKKAYRAKALKLHPDRHLDKSAEEKALVEEEFQLVTLSHSVLSDAHKRQLYDTGGRFSDIASLSSDGPDRRGSKARDAWARRQKATPRPAFSSALADAPKAAKEVPAEPVAAVALSKGLVACLLVLTVAVGIAALSARVLGEASPAQGAATTTRAPLPGATASALAPSPGEKMAAVAAGTAWAAAGTAGALMLLPAVRSSVRGLSSLARGVAAVAGHGGAPAGRIAAAAAHGSAAAVGARRLRPLLLMQRAAEADMALSLVRVAFRAVTGAPASRAAKVVSAANSLSRSAPLLV